MIEQTRFLSTVFLCTAFKLENIYLGVNLCGNFISGNLFWGIAGKIAKISTHNNIAPHSVYRYLKQIEGEIVACVQTPAPLEFLLRGVLVNPLPPPPPWNFRNFSTWFGTLWKEYLCKKSCCTIFFNVKFNFSAIK